MKSTQNTAVRAKRDAAAVGREEVPPTLKKKQGKGKELDVGSSKCIEDSKAEVLEIKKMFLETMEAAKLQNKIKIKVTPFQKVQPLQQTTADYEDQSHTNRLTDRTPSMQSTSVQYLLSSHQTKLIGLIGN